VQPQNNSKREPGVNMMRRSRLTMTLFALGVSALIVLNLYTFIAAYPEIYALSPGINTSGHILAKDFSAYYVAAWRLWNNPAHIYAVGALGGGEPVINPAPEAFKYLPSFLLLTSPLLALTYQQALLAFDIFQFLLLPLMALLLYRMLEKKGLALTFIVMVIALLLPFPTSQWGFSPSYYWQWGEGQAKVLEMFLLLLSIYLASRGRSVLSGVVLAFGFFDPRFGLLAVPLFVMYNWKSLKLALPSLAGALVLSNIVLFYPGTGASFVNMVFLSSLSTPLYYYSLIPFFTFVVLIFVNLKEMIVTFDYYEVFKLYTKNWNIQK
jgi:hypothetical protein